MHFVDAKGILTNNHGSYGMNIYRGCSHGCIYCDSRSTCYQFTHPFEDIEVKQNAPELLEKALRSKRSKCMIGLYAEKPGELARALFEGDSFDNFLLVRAQIRTEIASEFDGRLAEGPEPYISWGRFRSVLPALPTQPGDVLPSSCHIVLCLSRSKTAGRSFRLTARWSPPGTSASAPSCCRICDRSLCRRRLSFRSFRQKTSVRTGLCDPVGRRFSIVCHKLRRAERDLTAF